MEIVGWVAAIVAMLGWTTALALFTRAVLPMANALKVLHQVDSLIDERIRETIEAIRSRRNKTPGAVMPASKIPDPTPAEQLSEIFGGPPIEPMTDQPGPEGYEA